MIKQDITQVIQWLKEGKKIRPKNRTLKILTDAPIIKVTYLDGNYEYSKFTPNNEYFNNKFTKLEIPIGKEVNEVAVCGIGNSKTYDVQYIYFNPQCNRTLCKLENGHITDYPFDLTDFIWDEFEVVTNENMKPLEMTMKELELHFGIPLRIIE